MPASEPVAAADTGQPSSIQPLLFELLFHRREQLLGGLFDQLLADAALKTGGDRVDPSQQSGLPRWLRACLLYTSDAADE